MAGTEGSRKIFEDLRAAVSAVPAGRRTVFSYPNDASPNDASLYLTLPGENPTPFSLLVPRYNTPEQFQTAFQALERRRVDYVIVSLLFVRGKDDPVLKFLEGRFVQRGVAGWGLYSIYTPAQPCADRGGCS